jgi:hypothetical protein
VHESITIYNDLRAEEGIDVWNAAKIPLLLGSFPHLTRMGYKAEVSYSFIDKELIKVTQNPADLREELNIPAKCVW